jgi:glycosyltransferase involved in cell wall biosynthesis
MPRCTGWWPPNLASSLPVAIDARRLQDRPLGGVGRWLANLVPHLAAGADVVLLTDGRHAPVARGVAEAPLWLPGRAPGVVWLQVGAAWWLRGFGGVFHGTFNALPAAWPGPAVVTIHDLAPLHHPEDFGNGHLKILTWRAQLRRAVRQARVIQTDSSFMRDSVVASYRVNPDRVVVARPAVDPVFSPARRGEGRLLAARLGVDSDYIVAVGGAPRRGLPVAIQAWSRARDAGIPHQLIVIGDSPSPVRRAGLVQAGRLLDPAWAGLLAGSSALCYPTRYEGFGMPALEAAACGVPVVCARVGPLPEVLGEAAEWCAAPTVDEIATGLIRVLSDQKRQADLGQAGLARVAASPTWAESARVLLDAYARAAS